MLRNESIWKLVEDEMVNILYLMSVAGMESVIFQYIYRRKCFMCHFNLKLVYYKYR